MSSCLPPSSSVPSASVPSSNVGVICGAEAGSSIPVMESVGGESVGVIGESVDVVGGDDMGNLYIGIGDNVTKIEVSEDIGATTSFGGIEDSVFVEEDIVGGGGTGVLCGGAGPLNESLVGANLGAEGGEEEVKGEKDKGNVEGGGGDGSSGSTESVSGGAEGVLGDNNGGGEDVSGANSGINVRPVPLITRRRLREILAHAEGECIMLVCVLCICRWWTLLCVLGVMLSPG